MTIILRMEVSSLARVMSPTGIRASWTWAFLSTMASTGGRRIQLAQNERGVSLAAPEEGLLLVQHVPVQAGGRVGEGGLVEAVDPHPEEGGVLLQLPLHRQVPLHRAQDGPLGEVLGQGEIPALPLLLRLGVGDGLGLGPELPEAPDRKSTRLYSTH